MTGLYKGREGLWQVCIKAGKVYDRFEWRQGRFMTPQWCGKSFAIFMKLFRYLFLLKGIIKGYNCLIKNPVILLNVLDEKKMQ